jgi:phenylacetate-CoA ligase
MTADGEVVEVERLPLEKLIEIENTKLRLALRRANMSPFYKDRWKTARVNFGRLHSVEDLCLLPFVNRKELFEEIRTKRGRIACSAVNTWFAGSSPTNPYEWFPFSAGDFLGIAPLLARMSRVVGLQTGDIVLAVVETSPRISSVIPYLYTCSEASRSQRLEFITGSLDWYDAMDMTWIDFMRRRRPTVLFTSTKNAVALSDKIYKDLKVRAGEILSNTRIGIFFGEPMEDYKAEIKEAYSLEAYEVYSPTENMSFCSECHVHNGIHLWMDTCIPEIIPHDREEAVPIWQAPSGTKGELVITNFAECFPLIRYKTGESVQVEGSGKCACGRTHPRINRLPKAQEPKKKS